MECFEMFSMQKLSNIFLWEFHPEFQAMKHASRFNLAEAKLCNNLINSFLLYFFSQTAGTVGIN